MANPQYLKRFRDHIKSLPTIADLFAMEEEYYLGTDRVAVILQASNLESILDDFLLTKMRKLMSKDEQDRLFDRSGPLSTFSSKIQLAYSLDLFGPTYRHDLNLIRELRNAFAHVRSPITLNIPEISSVCANLMVSDLVGSQLPRSYSEKYDINIVTDSNHPRTRFTRSAHTMSFRMLETTAALNGHPQGVLHSLP